MCGSWTPNIYFLYIFFLAQYQKDLEGTWKIWDIDQSTHGGQGGLLNEKITAN